MATFKEEVEGIRRAIGENEKNIAMAKDDTRELAYQLSELMHSLPTALRDSLHKLQQADQVGWEVLEFEPNDGRIVVIDESDTEVEFTGKLSVTINNDTGNCDAVLTSGELRIIADMLDDNNIWED